MEREEKYTMKKILKLVICCVLVLGLITIISANTNKTSALGETSNIESFETKYNYDTIDVNKSPNFHVNDTTSDASRIRTSPHFINTNKFTTSNEKKCTIK